MGELRATGETGFPPRPRHEMVSPSPEAEASAPGGQAKQFLEFLTVRKFCLFIFLY